MKKAPEKNALKNTVPENIAPEKCAQKMCPKNVLEQKWRKFVLKNLFPYWNTKFEKLCP